MTTLYHAPMSRSSSILALVRELDPTIEVQTVNVRRADGSGGPDPKNPHPESRVPYLVDGDEHLRERGAIVLYLTDKYPEAGLAPKIGEPGRGAYLTWLSYYQGVMEPVFIMTMLDQATPESTAAYGSFDDMIASLDRALQKGPYLLGERYSAADLLCASPFQWMPQMIPDNARIRDWVARCNERPSVAQVVAEEMAPA